MSFFSVSRTVIGSDKSLALSQSQQPGSFMCCHANAELSVRGKYSFIWLLFAAILRLGLSDGAKWAQHLPFTGGYSKAGLSDGVKCGLFRCDGWYHLPLGKSGGHVWAEGGDEGGIDVRLVVDLASVQGHAWEKSERRRRGKKSQDPLWEVLHSCHNPSSCSQKKEKKKEKRERN